jgi:DNA polymerase III epsilon subunit-like protein
VDTETTGLSSGYHEVTQISIIRCSDRNQLNKYIKAEFPKRANPDALKYTGRTYADLYKGDGKQEVIEICNNFFAEDEAEPEDRCIIGHSIWSFDKRFLHAMWGSVGLEFPANLWLDTIPYVKDYMKKKGLTEKRYNLTKACEVVGLKPRKGAHNAVVDTQNNYRLWDALKETHGISQLPHIKRQAHTLEEE